LKKIKFYFFIILIININIFSISLWDDRAADIYSKKIYYNIGDTVEVIINESTNIDYKTSTKSVKSYKLNISGGEISGIFDFIPAGSVEENKTGSDKDTLKINNSIQARITGVNNNMVTLQGVKNIVVNNKNNSIVLTGEANVFDIKDNAVLSNKLINSTIAITTLLDNKNNIINNIDLTEERVNPDSTTDTRTKTKLSEEKRRELLLLYFNKILNVIF